MHRRGNNRDWERDRDYYEQSQGSSSRNDRNYYGEDYNPRPYSPHERSRYGEEPHHRPYPRSDFQRSPYGDRRSNYQHYPSPPDISAPSNNYSRRRDTSPVPENMRERIRNVLNEKTDFFYDVIVWIAYLFKYGVSDNLSKLFIYCLVLHQNINLS